MNHAGIGDECLEATRYLNYDHPSLQECAQQLVTGREDEIERAKKVFEFVRDEIEYNFAPEVLSTDDLKASHTLRLGNGFCVQKAVLLAALWRAVGIPSKVGFQDIRSLRVPQKFWDLLGNEIGYHGLNAVRLGGRWIRLDGTLDRALVERRRYRLCEFSCTEDVLLRPTDLDDNPHFVILKDYGDFPDMPQDIAEWQVREFKRLDDKGWRTLVRGEGASM